MLEHSTILREGDQMPLHATAIDARTYPRVYQQRQTTFGIPHPYSIEKGGWIQLLWEEHPHPPKRRITTVRTIQVTEERAIQAMHALTANKPLV